MGSAVRILNSGAEHTRAQSQIDAARITQKSRNAYEMSVVEAKRLVQQSNNAASTMYASANRRVQSANNAASASLVAAQRQLQVNYNDQAEQVAAAKERLRLARNEASAAKSSFSLWGQSRQNQKLMKAGGERVNQITGEMLGLVDASTNGNMFEKLASSEALGASMSAAAVAGVGTSFMEHYTSTVNLREGLRQERADRELNSRLHAGAQARARALGDSIDSLQIGQDFAELDYSVNTAQTDYTAILDEQDFGPIIDEQDYEVFSPNLDYTVYVDHKKMGLGTKLFSFAAAAGATYLGGPQAGMAVLDVFQAQNDMENGNFAGAQQGFANAGANLAGGWKAYRAGAGPKTGGGSTVGSAYGAKLVSNAASWLQLK